MMPVLGLVVAIAVEGPVVLVVALRAQGRQVLTTWLMLVVGANLITYFPFLAAMGMLSPRWGETASLVALEATVSFVEGTVYAKAGDIGWPRGLILGMVANALSYGAGLLLWPAG